jgi:exopolysaccharide/PEP-CTERM locus tyrosine autokinase
MSKIEKALERAKKQRHAGEKETPDKPAAPVHDIQDEPPEYLQTQVVSLDTGHLEKHRLMTFLDDAQVMDCFNLLRTHVLEKTRDKGHNTIMVTSVVGGEGKTVTAINLAASISRDVKQTVLLVDTDLRGPKIHHYLGCNTGKGLSDYFRHDTPVSELLINPGMDKMTVLLGGKPLSGPTEILGSPKMEKLVQEMKHRYSDRYIIFDCPPVLAMPDALVFSSYVDGVILVVEAGKTPREQIRKAVEQLNGRNILGLVMNKSKEKNRAYGYGYY